MEKVLLVSGVVVLGVEFEREARVAVGVDSSAGSWIDSRTGFGGGDGVSGSLVEVVEMCGKEGRVVEAISLTFDSTVEIGRAHV